MWLVTGSQLYRGEDAIVRAKFRGHMMSLTLDDAQKVTVE